MANAKRRRRQQLEAPERIDELLERTGEHRFAKRQLPIPLAEWRAAVGPRIADRARPVALDRGVLVIKVVSSVWANELSMLGPQLLAKLAERGFEVKALRFRVGPIEVIEGIPQKKSYRQVPPPAPLAPEMERSLARIEDDELRAVIERAARANLAWQAAASVNATTRGARAPRDAGTRSAPPDRSEAGSGAASPRKRGGDSDPPR